MPTMPAIHFTLTEMLRSEPKIGKAYVSYFSADLSLAVLSSPGRRATIY